MATKILYVLLGLFLVGVLNIVYSFFVMFVTIFLMGIENELFLTIQSYVIFALAAVTAFALIYKIWPKEVCKSPQPDAEQRIPTQEQV